MDRPKKVNVRFTRAWQSYGPGERAGFRPLVAADLIKKGIAVIAPMSDDEPAAPTGQSSGVSEQLKAR